MKRIGYLWAVAATATALLTIGCGDGAYREDIDAKHAERIEALRSDTGWLTLVGLHALEEGVFEIGSGEAADIRLADAAPARLGTLAIEGADVMFAAAPDVEVSIVGGDGAVTHQVLDTDRDGDPTVLACGSLVFHVIERDGDLYLRVKDRDSSVLRDFTGIDRFPLDAAWRVTARLETGGSGMVTMPDVLGNATPSPSPGDLVFEIDGRTLRLTPVGKPAEGLFLVFGDATNGHATYAGGRFLSTGPVAEDGTVVLDFNLAVNPPCVFTQFATCPLPPEGNMLTAAVEAGEKMWGEQH
jgi:uncharacterized protein